MAALILKRALLGIRWHGCNSPTSDIPRDAQLTELFGLDRK
jgi:hypothetical protein